MKLLPIFTRAALRIATAVALWVATVSSLLGFETSRHLVEPGLNDGKIAYVTAMMLWQNHYSHHPLDNEFSAKFFNGYLDSLDPQHLHFTQADLTEFDYYREKLDDLTSKRTGDATPAFDIFNRFFERLQQRVAYVEELLKAGQFEFKDDERMQVNRKDAPYPKDLTEAKQLWKQRLRHEYLQEKLGRHAAKKADEKSTDKQPAATESKAPKKTEAEEITEALTKRYARNLRLFKEWDNNDVMQVYLTALAHVYDPHSDYFNPAQADNFAIGMNNALIGIGAVLTTDLDGYCKIQELKPGPAMNSKKIKAGDRIVAVAQSNAPPVDAIDMALNKVVQMIRGPKGTEVRLTVQPANKDAADRYVLSLIREEIKLEDQAAKAKVIDLPNEKGAPLRLGVIDLPSFYAPIHFGDSQPTVGASDAANYGRFTSRDVAAFLKKFEREKVSGVILDLRRNGGGSLEEAVRLTGLFIKDGPVVQVKSSDDSLFVDEDEDPSVTYSGPLIVLTSRFSASASEIVAGALQDYGRALIVGDQTTHGKGTVQRVLGLASPMRITNPTNNPGQLKITMSMFYRASGASTQLRGVLPDIVLPSIFNHSTEIGEAALDNALHAAPIQSAKFTKLDLVAPYLGELLRHSTQRIATNQDFVYVREDIEQFRKAQADKTVSLNEASRLKEKDEAEARQKARDKERLARKESPKVVYELALKQVDLPGLPAPVAKTNAVATVSGKPTAAIVATNSAAISLKAPEATVQPDNEEDEEKAPVVDATLEEAEQILKDYIQLLARKNLLSIKQGS